MPEATQLERLGQFDEDCVPYRCQRCGAAVARGEPLQTAEIRLMPLGSDPDGDPPGPFGWQVKEVDLCDACAVEGAVMFRRWVNEFKEWFGGMSWLDPRLITRGLE